MGMTSRERRDRLFRNSRPTVRRLEIMDGEGYGRDIGVLWAAYQAGSFHDMPAALDQEAFLTSIEALQEQHDQVWVIDDINAAYGSKLGPVALCCTSANGLAITVAGTAFKWATKRNRFRAAASFLNMIRHSKKTGVALVRGGKASLAFLRPMRKLDLLHYVGKIDSDAYLFSMRGRGSEVG